MQSAYESSRSSQPQAGSQGRTAAVGAAELERMVRMLESKLDDTGRSNFLTRMLTLGGMLTLLGMAAYFGSSLWSSVQQKMAPEKVQAALMSKVDSEWPGLSKKLTDEVMEAVPEYSNLALARGTQLLPELSSRLAGEATTFAEDVEKTVRQRADDAMTRVAGKLTSDLKRDFPKLTEARVETLSKKLREGMIGEGSVVADELRATIAKEQTKIGDMLEKLPVAQMATQTEESLQKSFIHHVLLMVDAIVADMPAGGVPTNQILPTTQELLGN